MVVVGLSLAIMTAYWELIDSPYVIHSSCTDLLILAVGIGGLWFKESCEAGRGH
jgi:hypothetical protein